MRRMLMLVLATFGASVLWAAPASAGGGCHTGVTQGSGEVVEIVDACFTPTTLRIEPGDTVMFVNRDPTVHNVVANGWGHFDDMSPDDRFRVSFDDAGVYPYACTYHPGMTGAVVVGDGSGAGSGAVVDVALEEEPPPAAVSTPAEPAGVAAGWIALAGIIGLASGIAIGRDRRTPGRSR